MASRVCRLLFVFILLFSFFLAPPLTSCTATVATCWFASVVLLSIYCLNEVVVVVVVSCEPDDLFYVFIYTYNGQEFTSGIVFFFRVKRASCNRYSVSKSDAKRQQQNYHALFIGSVHKDAVSF